MYKNAKLLKMTELLIARVSLVGVIITSVFLLLGGAFYIWQDVSIGKRIIFVGLWVLIVTQLTRVLLTGLMFWQGKEKVLAMSAMFVFCVLLLSILIGSVGIP